MSESAEELRTLHEESFARAFIASRRRERFLTQLSSSRGRAKLRAGLGHFKSLDSRFAHGLPSSISSAQIEELLVNKGAGKRCHVIAEDGEIDGREMELHAILAEIVGRQSGVILSCIAGHLAYYEGEDAGFRLILER